MFDPDGAQAAADSTRHSASLGTGRSVNARTARRLLTPSSTSTIPFLPSAYPLCRTYLWIGFLTTFSMPGVISQGRERRQFCLMKNPLLYRSAWPESSREASEIGRAI